MNNVFVNTIPHSGTHLVTKVIEALGYQHAIIENKFYSVKPFYRRKQRAGINWRQSKEFGNLFSFFEPKTVLVSVASPRLVRSSLIKNLLLKIDNGNYIIGHMPYSNDGKKLIEKYINKTITIIRDPRDMAVSMINHSRTRSNHHANEYLFNILHSESQRLKAVLLGYKNQYGSLIGIEKMYKSMTLWSHQPNNLTIKFEDLVGEKGGGSLEKQIETIKQIINHLDMEVDLSDENILAIAKSSYGSSGTFRKGQVGAWRDVFNNQDKQLYKSNINELLENLNYEIKRI